MGQTVKRILLASKYSWALYFDGKKLIISEDATRSKIGDIGQNIVAIKENNASLII